MSNPIQPPSFAADQHVQSLDSPREGQDRTSDEIDLFELWQVLWRQKWLIMLFSILGAGIGVLVALSSPPMYRAEVIMEAVAEDQKGSGGAAGLLAQYGGLASLAGTSIGGASSSKGTALAILQSRSFLETFINDEKIIPILFSKKWDLASQSWQEDTTPKKVTLWDAVNYFKDGIFKVNDDKKTSMITLSIEWRDREQAAQWANQLVEKINRHMLERTIQEASKGIDYLKDEWSKNGAVELQQAIAGLMESQIKKIMLSKVRPDYAFTIIDPAVAPPLGNHFKPRKSMMVQIGAFAGIAFGILTALFRNAIRSRKKKQPNNSLP
ncbi:MAG: hypothetical protein HQL74_04860 [Magnetococcales bacterium]|nr:hypothetical protein [Magnetococcales bacterium]